MFMNEAEWPMMVLGHPSPAGRIVSVGRAHPAAEGTRSRSYVL